MSSICHSCASDITDAHVICQGFCNATFHPRCTGIAANGFDEVMKNHQMFWLCKSCSTLMRDIRFRSVARCAQEIGQEQALNSHSDILKDLKSEILAELKAVIQSNFTALINSSSHTPKSTLRANIEPRFTKARRLFSTTTAPTEQLLPLLHGTGSTLSPSVNVATVPPATPKFWLYISRIARDVSADQVAALAKNRLGTNDVKVVRLVAKGQDVNFLSFVSFKVGISANLKAKALASSTWPRGIVYREFRDNKSSDVAWRPQPAELNDPLHISSELDMM